MIFDLVNDFADVLDAMPSEHPKKKILKLLEEAIRRDVQFIDRHPTTFFQCMWNTCWWYDSSEAIHGLEISSLSECDVRDLMHSKLSILLESWKVLKEKTASDFVWIRSLRPPAIRLGSQQTIEFKHSILTSSYALFSPDGTLLACSQQEPVGSYKIQLRNVLTGMIIRQWHVHNAAINSLEFSPNGQQILSASDDGTVAVSNVKTGQVQLQIPTGLARVRHAGFSVDGTLIATSSSTNPKSPFSLVNDSSVQTWDLITGNCIMDWKVETASKLFFTRDGCHIYMGELPTVFSVETGELVHKHEFSEGPICSSLAYSPNGNLMATGHVDGRVRLWELQEHHKVALGELYGHKGEVAAIDFSIDGTQLVTGSHDHTLRVWNVNSQTELMTFDIHRSHVVSVKFSPDSRHVASSSWDGKTRVLNISPDTNHDDQFVRKGPRGGVINFSFSPDARKLLTSSGDGVGVWDAQSGRFLALLITKGAVKKVFYSRDGLRIAAATYYPESPSAFSVTIWDSESLEQLAILEGHERAVNDIDFSADHEHVVTASDDKTARVWDMQTGIQLVQLKHDAEVMCVLYGHRGKHILSGLADGKIISWNAANHEKTTQVCDHKGEVTSFAISPNNKFLATSSMDCTIRIRDLVTIKTVKFLFGAKHGISDCRFSKDGQRVFGEQPWHSGNKTWEWDLRGMKKVGKMMWLYRFLWFLFKAHPDDSILAEGHENPRIWEAIRCAPIVDIGEELLPFAINNNCGETEILSSDSKQTIAWWPDELYQARTQTGGRQWWGLRLLMDIECIHIEGGTDEVSEKRSHR